MTDLRTAFEAIDSNGDAKIDLIEFRKLAAELGVERDAAGVEALFDAIDKSENGLIDFDEFEAWWSTSDFSK